ncbi:MAG: hypothetical protein JXR76_26345 [Deltaproteobacteria bacterium]|nr:hypothetical protein [Deltaproteobacteria bacterium]
MRNLIRLFCMWLVYLMLMGCGESAGSMEKNGGETNDSDQDLSIPMDFYRQCTGTKCQFELYDGEGYEYNAVTWHPLDTGILLNGDSLLMGVCDEYAAHPDVLVDCYAVSVMGHWDESVRLKLEVRAEYGELEVDGCETNVATEDSINAGGENQFVWTGRLKKRDWRPEKWIFRTLKQQGLMRFFIRKESPGDAMFYYIKVEGLIDDECPANAIEVD